MGGLKLLGYKGRLKKTGQTTQYSSELDDGYYQKGLAAAYTVLSTGQYSGTSNIDLAHYAGGAGAIAFDNVAKTITDTGNGLAQFKTNDVILTDDVDNPGPFTVTTGNVAGTITCTGATFVTKTPAGVVTISKREAHSNNCVLDLNTGLMWSRYVSANMGTASNGLMPWTGQLYDIFQYAAAANTASLGGYTDWRPCNRKELSDLLNDENDYAVPNTTAFPSFPSVATAGTWTSTTSKHTTTSAWAYDGPDGAITSTAKAAAYHCFLVRGG